MTVLQIEINKHELEVELGVTRVDNHRLQKDLAESVEIATSSKVRMLKMNEILAEIGKNCVSDITNASLKSSTPYLLNSNVSSY